ncbi:hypothetical protein CROQUDRAFT_98252 [Cronartium quercuum f. sp. fusiforme G11]|uniref:F-BAR domain-containing protein n=1 Tax=Cronartium quercuum f. sp. fusiforme G11 TaxID=708437 RepID=A0A9P6T7V3_9BASI|nr:hypothetical protein CROQUDRAFT_98252 [Cronartium quercuum f. sp. fusiforme G11]
MARFRNLFQSRKRSHQNHSAESSSTSSRSELESQNFDSILINEFCNSFWGDGGYEKLLKRVKMSDKMLDDLKSWFKERASIEADYSKRLTRLSKASVFSDMNFEGDGLNRGLERLQEATARSAHSHAELSKTFKQELETRVSEFITRRDGSRKTSQALIEKLHKKLEEFKSLQEKVNPFPSCTIHRTHTESCARKRFEVDSIAVNGYGAQLHLVQGREMDRVTIKLDKAKASIVGTEKNYRVLTRNLEDTAEQWTLQWKMFCDLIQDLEEDRIDFIRSTLWNYANGLSAVSVLEDEQCEVIRKTLERCDTERDIRQFISQSSTGAELYRAPPFIDYVNGQHEAPKFEGNPRNRRIAKFQRNSSRVFQTSPINSSRVVQDLVHSIQRPPSLQTSAHAEEEHESIPYVPRKVGRYGGSIADVIASNSIAPNFVPFDRAVTLLPCRSSHETHQPLHDPHHHDHFNGPGILVNH